MADQAKIGLPSNMVWHPSPNINDRASGVKPDILLLHFTAMQTAISAVERLCDPQARVSCHYVIGETGQVWHLVKEDMRAWHAGLGRWGEITEDINSRSIGIELANTGLHPFPEPQMRVLEAMMHGIMARWGIGPERVIGHSDMAPHRKDDPGPRFDWRRLALQGLAIWPDSHVTGDEDLGQFRVLSTKLGYGVDFDDAPVLRAIRLRFRPWARGPLDQTDIAIMNDLAARFPVDRTISSA